jgi:AcrR family transcriptional regulator
MIAKNNKRPLFSSKMKHFPPKKIPTNIKNEALVTRRREQIFDAVIKLFSKKGYHSTTLREISKESNITLGNLYDYISTKEDILYIIQEKATQAVMDAISKDQEEILDPVEKLKNLINSELNAMNWLQNLVLIIYQESHAMGKEVLYSLLKSERRHLQQFEKLIEEGIRKEAFRPVNVRMSANLIKMLIDTWVVKRWDLRGKVSLEEMRKGILDLVFNGIMKHKSQRIKHHPARRIDKRKNEKSR